MTRILVILGIFLFSSGVGSSELTTPLQSYIAEANAPRSAVQKVETRISELIGNECSFSSLTIELRCVLDASRLACEGEQDISLASCQIWSDIFISAYSDLSDVLNREERRRARHSGTEVLRYFVNTRSRRVAETYSLLEPVYDAPHLESFCLEHARHLNVPIPVCLSLVLMGKNSR